MSKYAKIDHYKINDEWLQIHLQLCRILADFHPRFVSGPEYAEDPRLKKMTGELENLKGDLESIGGYIDHLLSLFDEGESDSPDSESDE